VRENGGQYSHAATWVVDAYLRLAELAAERGDATTAERRTARAAECWRKISPLDRDTPEAQRRYGLAPHQQPADIYDGVGHDGRGGWSWYTGAAARMLSAAYSLVGLEMERGALHVRPRPGLAATRMGSISVHVPGEARVPVDA
jgi:cyclic beta-1,2-glucan synthetase